MNDDIFIGDIALSYYGIRPVVRAMYDGHVRTDKSNVVAPFAVLRTWCTEAEVQLCSRSDRG